MRWGAFLGANGVWYPIPRRKSDDAEFRKRVMSIFDLKPLTRKERAALKRRAVKW